MYEPTAEVLEEADVYLTAAMTGQSPSDDFDGAEAVTANALMSIAASLLVIARTVNEGQARSDRRGTPIEFETKAAPDA